MHKRWLWGVMVLMLICALPVLGQASDADKGYQEALRRIESALTKGDSILNLSELSLTALPPEIGQLSKLDALNLTHNQLTALPPEITQLSRLRGLYLGGNLFTMLPVEITQLSNLEWINLANNQLTTLPPEIGQLYNLLGINLVYNQLTTLPPEIGQLANLESLIIEGNPLKTLPSEIGQLSNLQLIGGGQLTFPSLEIQKQGPQAVLIYLRDYHTMLVRQTIAAIAAGVGGIALLLLAFRWRQRRGLSEKKKRA